MVYHHQNLIELYIKVSLKEGGGGGADGGGGSNRGYYGSKDLEVESLDLLQCTFTGQTLKTDKKH
jgi:hypothetical protein